MNESGALKYMIQYIRDDSRPFEVIVYSNQLPDKIGGLQIIYVHFVLAHFIISIICFM